jgi:sterol desaturase/sphingolipid hydroxylase (fatty acid hydroxylase superfamily)
MKKYWFKAKKYGYGWYPATKEGWLVMLVWLVAFLALVKIFLLNLKDGPKELYWYLPSVFLITGILIFVAYKTGEPARWRWGEDDKKENKK